MDKKWEIRRISTSERILNKIREEMAQPVGIVIFGADCEFKNEVKREIIDSLDLQAGSAGWEADYEDAGCYLRAEHHFRYRFEAGRNFATVVLDSTNSSDHEIRHGFVMAARNAGAKTVVGVYVKVNQKPIRPLVSTLERLEFDKRVAAIEQSNPTADGLDYFIMVEEEKEG